MALMEKELAELSLDEEEDKGLQFAFVVTLPISLDEEEDKGLQFAFVVTLPKSMYDLCLIGLLSHSKCHSLLGSEEHDDSSIRLMWNQVDVERVMIETPWTFNNHLLLLHRLKEGEYPNLMPLVFSNFWVQVHELSQGFFSDHVAQQLGDFVGKFLENLLEHDTKQI
ncbi:hypothetical protein Goshw_017466 [Gossypium schwendimanii]|uniref:DUF4283 domain-containing protein n=1 Tax=Gossypium schwendimanii TaxID=34291 RepID=A0A7J9N340_GOSSC|nr:hypothetical protein [Gossypium schwendimanii]